MKKLLLIALLIVGAGFSQNLIVDSTSIKYNKIILPDSIKWHRATQSIILMPIIAKTKKDNDGNIVGLNGLMIFPTGYYSKTYFKPLKVNTWNPYWQWGTVLVAPYYGLGTEYIGGNGFFFGIGTVYFFPLISFGKYF